MKIMFVCTGNSARSQMAEGWARYLSKGKWEVHSAGVKPKGVNPHAIAAMQEIGIDISQQKSTNLDYELMGQMDVIVTLCDNAKESCPDEQKKQLFKTVRDEIRERIKKLLQGLS